MSPKWLSNRSDKPTAPNATLQLSAEKTQYVLGDHVKGGIKIVSQEEFDVNQAIVCLSCNENIRRNQVWSNQFGVQQSEYWENAVTYSTTFKLFDLVHIPQGFSANYQYDLEISPAATPTIYTIDHYAKWLLAAVLQVKDRPNIPTQNYEIQVEKPVNGQAVPIVTKEVEREIVLVPCSYCGSLMPQTALFCPNCGARKK
ncbi:MAG: zinc-ribbon domain-containing protein [Candidatus Bathyarchaeia archaeon]